MSPLQAIRGFCLWCAYGATRHVNLCPAAETCPLFEHRFGRRHGLPKPLEAIQARCSTCVQNPFACKTTTCSLHSFRMGVDPVAQMRQRARNRFLGQKRLSTGGIGEFPVVEH